MTKDVVGLSFGAKDKICVGAKDKICDCCREEHKSGIGTFGRFLCDDCIRDMIDFIIPCIRPKPTIPIDTVDSPWICDCCGEEYKGVIHVDVMYESDVDFNRKYCMPCYVRGMDASMRLGLDDKKREDSENPTE